MDDGAFSQLAREDVIQELVDHGFGFKGAENGICKVGRLSRVFLLRPGHVHLVRHVLGVHVPKEPEKVAQELGHVPVKVRLAPA